MEAFRRMAPARAPCMVSTMVTVYPDFSKRRGESVISIDFVLVCKVRNYYSMVRIY